MRLVAWLETKLIRLAHDLVLLCINPLFQLDGDVAGSGLISLRNGKTIFLCERVCCCLGNSHSHGDMSCFETNHTDHRLPLTDPHMLWVVESCECLKGLNRQIRRLCDGSDRAQVPIRWLTDPKYQEPDEGLVTHSCSHADSSFLSFFDAVICSW